MRGFPGVLTRRRVTTAVVVVATGSVATVAVAAGPVIYSEYTTGGDREGRVVRPDGTDTPLPLDAVGAAVSPDGRRIAQTTLQTAPGSNGRYSSSLRVTAGDGTDAITLVQHASGDTGGRLKIVTGTPVWSPDSTSVLAYRTEIKNEDVARTVRVICAVDAKTCKDAGVVPAAGEVADRNDFDESGLRGDVVTWQQTDGPIVHDTVRDTTALTRVRCGTTPRPAQLPTVRLRGLAGSGFGDPLALRGLAGDGATLDPATAGALAVPGGTLAADLPGAVVKTGRIRCGGSSGTATRRTTIGTARVRLRAGGKTTSLPTPPGLHRGDGLRLVGTDDGGAILISTTVPAGESRLFCDGRRNSKIRDCRGGYSDGSSYGDDDGRPLRVWRYVAAPAPHFERITTARRSALQTLKAASTFTVASGDAVLAVTDDAIERVPLDGGAPTTVARGRGISLDLGSW